MGSTLIGRESRYPEGGVGIKRHDAGDEGEVIHAYMTHRQMCWVAALRVDVVRL